MRLYNQISKPLSFKLDGVKFDVEAWGSVEMAEAQAKAAKDRGLPLAAVPAAPETRTLVLSQDQREQEDKSVTIKLKREAEDAKTALVGAKSENETLTVELDKARTANVALEAKLAALTDENAALKAETKRLGVTIDELTKGAAAATEARVREEALAPEGKTEGQSTGKPLKPLRSRQ